MGVRVESACGTLEGTREGEVHVFRAIPFAQPPVGPLRFQPPQPVPPWRGVRPAVAYGGAAPQPVMPHNEALPMPPMDLGAEQSEDCLYLNVMTPSPDDAKRPVMVNIHGGNFTMGSASAGAGGGRAVSLVQRGDVVHVSMNYRLGAIGFLNLVDVCGDTLDSTPNRGVLDQIAALQWVHDNIAAFGGDPDNVTIMGVSAGGMAVGTLLGTPAACGLFQRAICQSGALHNVHSREVGNRVTRGFLAELGVDPADAKRLLDIPAADLVAAQERYYNLMTTFTLLQDFSIVDRPSPAYAIAYQPVADGTVIPEPAIDAVRGGLSAGVSVMSGHTADEQKMGAMFDPNSPKDEAAFLTAIAQRVRTTAADGHPDAEHLRDVYVGEHGDLTPDQRFALLDTDRIFRIPAVRLAELQSARQAQTYTYVFDWESPIPGVGAAHGMDVIFLYDMLDQPGMEMYAGVGDEAQALVETMQDAWVSFARSGDPSHPGIGTWDAYDVDRRATMRIGRACRVEDDPAPVTRQAWDTLL